MAEFTDKERFFQLLEEHHDLTMQFLRSKAKDVSQVELVSFDTERMTGVLTVFNWEGVKKIVAVSPESLIQTLTSLNDDIRERCDAAAQAAETAASYANTQGQYANTQGTYAKQQGDRAVQLIQELTALGLTVEAQGQGAIDAMNEVIAWYSPFRQNAESWYSGLVREVGNWFSGVKTQWTEWFNSSCNQWLLWFGETTAAWAAWFSDKKTDWEEWFAARKTAWNTWFDETSSAWTLWFASVKGDWNTWFGNVTSTWDAWYQAVRTIVSGWEQKEQERQSAEEIRLELMAHPPIPSTNGYWMMWDLDTHAYVESGWSSRGTMDWPEFFWDYETMGVGVITTRDYSRFKIDEQGRFKMKM